MGGRPSSTDRFAKAMVSRAANSIHHNVFSRCITRFHGTVPQSVFATEEFSDATFIIVNAMLYNLFMKQSSPATHPTARDEYHTFMRQTQANLETALANAHLFLATRVENVQALLLGAIYAVDVSRPSVAWHLACMAAQLCQTGVYHRSESLKHDTPETAKLKERILF